MDPQPTPDQQTVQSTPSSTPIAHHFTKVTSVSKVLATIVFITLPFVGFWLGMGYGKERCVSSSAGIESGPVVNESEESKDVSNQAVDTVKAGDASGSISSTSIVTTYQKPVRATNVQMLPADETTETVNMGEYLIRYEREHPKTLQVLYPHDGEPYVTQEVEWEFPSEAIKNTYRNGIDERVMVGNDFNYDGYTDVGLVVWFYRGFFQHQLYIFNPETFRLDPLFIDGAVGGGQYSGVELDVKNKILKITNPVPSTTEVGETNYITVEYVFDGGKYVKVGSHTE